MKKYAVLVLVVLMAVFGTTSVFAKAFGGKLIYNNMMDDYEAADYESNLSGGIFFEVGPSFFDSRFRPGIDFVTLENDDYEWATVYAFHMDFYWFFLKGKAITPFIGVGPAFNYFNFDDDTADGDSDAGIDFFGGAEWNFSGPWSLLAEIRLVQHDVANFDQRILKGAIGIVYYF